MERVEVASEAGDISLLRRAAGVGYEPLEVVVWTCYGEGARRRTDVSEGRSWRYIEGRDADLERTHDLGADLC
jgi:hypothetical protein